MLATATLPRWARGPSLAPAPLDGSVPVTGELFADHAAWGDGLQRFHGPAAEVCGVLDTPHEHAPGGWVDEHSSRQYDGLASLSIDRGEPRFGRSRIVTHAWGTWTIRRRMRVNPRQAPGDFAAGLPGVLMVPQGYDWRGWDGDPAAMLEELRGVVLEMLREEAGR